MIKFICFITIQFISLITFSKSEEFRIPILAEPKSLDLTEQKNILGNTLQQIAYRSYFRIARDQIEKDLVEDCQFKTLKSIECKFKSGIKYSDGSPILPEHFLNTISILKTKSACLELAPILQNIKKTELKNSALIFNLFQDDPLFLYRLSSPLFAPVPSRETQLLTKSGSYLTHGPWKIESWIKGQKIVLVPNYNFEKPIQQDIKVILIPIFDDLLAFKMYKKGDLSLLRRLPSQFYKDYQNSGEQLNTLTARFDYIGFGPSMKNRSELRKILSTQLNFKEWQKVIAATHPLGCPSLPDSYLLDRPCLQFNPESNSPKLKENLKLIYSLQGGDDHRRSMEWLQLQWRKRTQTKVGLFPMEQSAFLETLKQNPPDIFRKGSPLTIPHCSDALLQFTSASNENYIQYKNLEFDQLVEDLKKSSADQARKLCQKGVEILIKDHRIIPLGQVTFRSLLNPKWKGVLFNDFNQLDLRDLSYIN